MQGSYVAQNRSVHKVHEDSSNGGTQQLPLEVEFRRMSITSSYHLKVLYNLQTYQGPLARKLRC